MAKSIIYLECPMCLGGKLHFDNGECPYCDLGMTEATQGELQNLETQSEQSSLKEFVKGYRHGKRLIWHFSNATRAEIAGNKAGLRNYKFPEGYKSRQ